MGISTVAGKEYREVGNLGGTLGDRVFLRPRVFKGLPLAMWKTGSCQHLLLPLICHSLIAPGSLSFQFLLVLPLGSPGLLLGLDCTAPFPSDGSTLVLKYGLEGALVTLLL